MAAKASHVRRLKSEALHLMLNREIEGLRIGSLQPVVDAPGDGEPARRTRGRWVGIGLRVCLRAGVADLRQLRARGEAGSCRVIGVAIDRVNTGWVGNGGADAVGTFPIEDIDQRLAKVIVVDARAGTDGGAAVGRVGEGKARREVILRLRPESGLVVEVA